MKNILVQAIIEVADNLDKIGMYEESSDLDKVLKSVYASKNIDNKIGQRILIEDGL
jgi:hypothetical protein